MEHAEPIIADETAAPASSSLEPEAEPLVEPAPQPKSRGRPVGAKDRQPRTRRPTIRVEPLPEPVEAPPQPRAPKPRALEAAPIATPPPPTPVEDAEEPPSPGTLYRETSQRLAHLRGLLNESRRASVADKYTSRLSLWAA